MTSSTSIKSSTEFHVNLKQFISFCESLLTIDKINFHFEANDPLKKSIEGSERKILGWIRPDSYDQVLKLIQAANDFSIPLYCISTGMNWGFGSHLPVRDDCVILELSGLNQISNYDSVLGTVDIEPGVTQRQLADFLTENGADYILDVTGSSEDSSILGNSLERGISYQHLRVNRLSNLQVILPDGSEITTGFGSYPNSKVKALYAHGIGPSLQGLFAQSNLGVVTKASYQLTPKPERQYMVTMSFSSKDIEAVIDEMRCLRYKGVVSGIWHIANRERVMENLVPIVDSELDSHGLLDSSSSTIRQLTGLLGLNDWILTGEISGTKKVAGAKKQEVARALGYWGKPRIIEKRYLAVVPKVLKFLGFKPLGVAISALNSLQGLNFGNPTKKTLLSVFGSEVCDHKNPVGASGFRYCTPLAPLIGDATVDMLEVLSEKLPNQSIPITINVISDHLQEGVISLRCSDDISRDIEQAYIERGFSLYRVGVDSMDLSKSPSGAYRKALEQLKDIWDPKKILSPGRYI